MLFHVETISRTRFAFVFLAPTHILEAAFHVDSMHLAWGHVSMRTVVFVCVPSGWLCNPDFR